MDGSGIVVGRSILSSVMHHIDSHSNSVQKVPISATANDLHGYLSKLLNEIQEQSHKRVYSPVSVATEFVTCLKSFLVNQRLDSNPSADLLAQRLMREETASEARHPNLNPVTKGSLLQFIYTDSGFTWYLGVKIEHSSFIDINALIRRSGLAEDRKLYKAVSVNIDTLSGPFDVQVFDTNGTPAVYWWKYFLELVVKRSDSENTKNAVDAVIKTVGILKREFPADYSVLRNATIAAFKQKSEMRFGNFVDNLLKSYVPIDGNAKPKLAIVEQKLRNLPITKNFDAQFTLDPSVVSYNQRKVVLSPEITLSIKEGVENLKDKIWASKTDDGRNVLVIQTENIKDFDFRG
ncbi:nucleoid-associated protein [Pseudoduganella umbonata]|uniref:Nucleoid-associated protein n=1 Tax=Pseudoduganella umbonata TaxID=864828 RepID=A0A4P8HT98_9BURK|nr:nucleoid-associated protein [Pseudoduganella umbonata]MBB3222269.1 hypothetical protein [Pseudoduganella umbonata]QCP12496.1 nucleoid-associated protein [Pseudoduganella umbonata]